MDEMFPGVLRWPSALGALWRRFDAPPPRPAPPSTPVADSTTLPAWLTVGLRLCTPPPPPPAPRDVDSASEKAEVSAASKRSMAPSSCRQ